MNLVEDEKCYRSILNYTSGKQAIERARNNVATKFSQSTPVEHFHVDISNDSASNEKIGTQFQNGTENDASCKETEIKGNTSYDPVTIELLLSNARLYQSKSIVPESIQKAMAILDKEEVSKSFEEGSYFVKSYTKRFPHLGSTKSTGNFSREEACERHINVRFCSHAIGVALYTESFEKYVSYLNRKFQTTTSVASKKVNKRKSGKKSCSEKDAVCALIKFPKKKTIQYISTYANFIKHFTSSNNDRS